MYPHPPPHMYVLVISAMGGHGRWWWWGVFHVEHGGRVVHMVRCSAPVRLPHPDSRPIHVRLDVVFVAGTPQPPRDCGVCVVLLASPLLVGCCLMHHTGRVLLSVPMWESVGVRSPFPATCSLRGCGGAIPVRLMLPVTRRRGGVRQVVPRRLRGGFLTVAL